MQPLQDSDDIKKVYYGIAEVCKMFGVNQSAIRFWVEEFQLEGIVAKYGRNKNSHRYRFSVDNTFLDIHAIYWLLKVELYTIEGAKIKFNLWKKGRFEIPTPVQINTSIRTSKESKSDSADNIGTDSNKSPL